MKRLANVSKLAVVAFLTVVSIGHKAQAEGPAGNAGGTPPPPPNLPPLDLVITVTANPIGSFSGDFGQLGLADLSGGIAGFDAGAGGGVQIDLGNLQLGQDPAAPEEKTEEVLEIVVTAPNRSSVDLVYNFIGRNFDSTAHFLQEVFFLRGALYEGPFHHGYPDDIDDALEYKVRELERKFGADSNTKSAREQLLLRSAFGPSYAVPDVDLSDRFGFAPLF